VLAPVAPREDPSPARDSAPEEVEARFRAARTAATEDAAGRARLQQAGADAAESLLRSGNIRRAAEVYRDAGLYEEAVHLYVNVLGAPGEAAPLLAAQGKHERAAELYELAGQVERAAAVWADVARASTHPEMYVDRIERLAAGVAFQLLEDVAVARPLSPQTAEIHYRLAQAVERRGDRRRAMDLYVALQGKVGPYKDVERQIAALRSAGPSVAPAPGAAAGAPARDAARRRSDSPPAASRAEPIGQARTLPSAPPRARDEVELSEVQISMIARQAAEVALERARLAAAPLSGLPAPKPTTVLEAPPARVVIVGLEQGKLPPEALIDPLVVAARSGPSIDTLRAFTGDRPCDLQNIEVYYRLGLAHLAEGQWAEALAAFAAVEEASPGYRDAERRAENIRSWRRAVGSRMTLGAPGGPSAGPPRYRIWGELGRGGMAVVYRAFDEVLGRDVALKFLSEELTSRKETREMFQREARSVAQLNHPNIVTIYDFGVLEGKAFISMEYLDGVSVGQMLAQHGRLAVIDALRVACQVLDALAYAHERKIVHRDVKPTNMMQTKTGLVKLMDFGLAKSVAQGAKASIVAGTPPYMPAEQLLGQEVDHRADLFAVGCSLYEMLTGQHPYSGFDRSTPPASVAEHDPALPAALDVVLQRALALDPAHRQQSAAEFAAPIRRILEAVGSYGAAPAGQAAAPGPG
jgi:tetratricopeptide (TPR) repeat protein